jgi:hypothetical protein
MSVPSQAHARTMAWHVTPGAGKQVPIALHRGDSGKPQSSSEAQSALVMQWRESPPASWAPELLDPELPPDEPDAPLDPEPPPDEPDAPLDPELPPDEPDPPPDPELPADEPDTPLDPELPLEPELPIDEPEAPFDPELALDPVPPFDPELSPEPLSAAASLKFRESRLPEQPTA